MDQRIVVVGAGLAGLQAVVALRARGYAGRLTLVGREPHEPYDRPPLSKAVLHGDADASTLAADWPALDVERLLGCSATGLAHGVLRTDGADLPFDGAVLATGARAVRLPGGPQHVLRTVEDARSLRAALRPGARVVVVGAGWIGAEVATAAARAGAAVTVLESLTAPLATALPAAVGARTTGWYGEAGVDLRLGERVADVALGAVHLERGPSLPADVVVSGVGVRPDTGWLDGSGVERDAGGAVLVGADLATSVPGVVAAGDCTTWWSRRYARHLHVEHWDTALHAPDVAAATLLGQPATYDPVPYFWSEQFGRMLQYVGDHAVADRAVERRGTGRDDWMVLWLRGPRLVAALACGRPRDLLQARRLVERGTEVDDAALADPAVAVRAALR